MNHGRSVTKQVMNCLTKYTKCAHVKGEELKLKRFVVGDPNELEIETREIEKQNERNV